MHYQGTLAFTITAQTPEQVTAEMPIQPGLLNPFGTVHAGAMLWFADVAATTLALEGRTPGAGMQGFPLAINLSANLLGNQRVGVLRAVAVYVRRGKTVSVVRTSVTGEDGRVIADVTTTHVAAR